MRGIKARPSFDVRLHGPLDRLEVGLSAKSGDLGRVTGELTADATAPGQSVKGEIAVDSLNLAPVARTLGPATDITATARLDVRTPSSFSALDSLSGALQVDAPTVQAAGFAAENVRLGAKLNGSRVAVDARADAYGASATTRGDVTLPGARRSPAYDLEGRLERLDLRRLPERLDVPRARTDVNVDYHVKGAGSNIDAELTTRPTEVAGTRLASGGTVGFSKHGPATAYRADTTIADLDLQRLGRELKVPALTGDRYHSDINGRLTATGQGTTLSTMSAAVQGVLTRSSVFGATLPQMTLRASLDSGTAHVAAKGDFAGLNPAAATGNASLKGDVAGSLDVEATVPDVPDGVDPSRIDARGSLNLQPSSVAGLDIKTAQITGAYSNRAAQVETFEVHGQGLNARASGSLALNDTDQSNLQFRADTPDLEEIGRLLGRPLQGTLRVSGAVTGNARDLHAAGTLVADNLQYGANGALTLSTKYDVRIPDLQPASTRATAETEATFVSIAGQHVNTLAAKTTYADRQIGFDATARQPERMVAVNGRLLLHPDHQEVHLERFDFRSRGVEWQVPAGVAPTINYAGGDVTITDLRLASGNQAITASGSFGRPGDSLQVALDGVQLTGVDALLLRPPQLTGTLNATTTIGGTTSSPDVQAQFKIEQGTFRQFKYQSLGGTVRYADAGLAADVRLQQTPDTWLTAKGSLPVALFKDPKTLAAAEASRRVDFHVDSSPIDVGLVQGFTTALTKASGVLEAHVDLVGTAASPDLSGHVAIHNAAFTVAPTGVSYAKLDGAIDLNTDRVHIATLRVEDNHQQPLTISGDLGLRGRQLGGVNIAVKSDDFKVLDNQMGNIRINSDLTIAGDARAPSVQGDLGISTGQLNLDPILAMAGQSAYATEPVSYPPSGTKAPPPPGPAPASDAAPGGVQVNVHVTVPDDLVVRSSDLKMPGSTFGFGSINLTLGGDLRVRKARASDLHLVGIVKTVRGTYDFQGRRFTIQRDGTVRFEGLPQPNPSLDITAGRQISGVQTNVHIRGRLREPTIELSSVPPLEQADILSLIVFNQPINQLGEGQQISLARRAQSMAEGAVAGQLAKSIGSALNLDTFEIQMAPTTGSAAQLTFGQQVGENLYVKLEQGVGQVATTNFILEYQLTDWLRLQTNILEGSSIQQSVFQRLQGSGVDLIFLFSY